VVTEAVFIIIIIVDQLNIFEERYPLIECIHLQGPGCINDMVTSIQNALMTMMMHVDRLGLSRVEIFAEMDPEGRLYEHISLFVALHILYI
jgi:hypothetical protein